MTNVLDETKLFYERFKRFKQLPKHCKNIYGAFQWIKAMVSSSGQAFAPHYFDQIPLRLVTDALRRYAISCDVRSLELIDPEDTEQYLSLCLLGYQTHFNAVRFFHEVAWTQGTVEAMLNEPVNFFQSYKSFPWIAQVMTPAMIEQASMASLDFMLTLHDDQISEAALQNNLGKGLFRFSRLRSEGRLSLGATFLKSGAWPEGVDGLEPAHSRPNSIESAFEMCLADEAQVYTALYMAWIKIQPIADVVTRVTCREHAALALEMFSADQILVAVGTNRHLKAGLLETAMGL